MASRTLPFNGSRGTLYSASPLPVRVDEG
ncbi:hypothetical protein CCACVL1_14144 [Corchorus capsularis]|uniref:Uncharacterized protein n=1 Tax=Corchorus capsularis TaxID=210143 RepID=A0A1R3I820_COCAP|nr:hypothetical protein CCACVL1_14144 [Corchorus capsularis]